ncbi:MAG: hypothetical protein ACYS17_02085 [Planctomycetota bacterium]|jgi:hypothetical protein
MIEKVDTNQIQSFLEKTSSRPPNAAADSTKNEVGVTVQVDYAAFIDSAMITPKTDSLIIEQTKELLLSGQLESPENIRKAAENIITLGI